VTDMLKKLAEKDLVNYKNIKAFPWQITVK
jgi:Mn-dependent DtxR family transcriptional regulator